MASLPSGMWHPCCTVIDISVHLTEHWSISIRPKLKASLYNNTFPGFSPKCISTHLDVSSLRAFQSVMTFQKDLQFASCLSACDLSTDCEGSIHHGNSASVALITQSLCTLLRHVNTHQHVHSLKRFTVEYTVQEYLICVKFNVPPKHYVHGEGHVVQFLTLLIYVFDCLCFNFKLKTK